MPKLTIYQNNDPIPGDKNELLKHIQDTIQNLSFFYERVQTEKAVMTDVHTHVGLMEQNFLKLAELTDYQTVLKDEKEERLKTIRETMEENRLLKEQAGQNILPEQGQAWLNLMINILDAWSNATGFHYMKLVYPLTWGLRIMLDDELTQEDALDEPRKQKTKLRRIIYEHTPSIYNHPDVKDWNIEYMDYHNCLLNTDRNKDNIIELITETFPESVICEFISRQNDNHNFILRPEIIIPYKAIWDYYQNCKQKDENKHKRA